MAGLITSTNSRTCRSVSSSKSPSSIYRCSQRRYWLRKRNSILKPSRFCSVLGRRWPTVRSNARCRCCSSTMNRTFDARSWRCRVNLCDSGQKIALADISSDRQQHRLRVYDVVAVQLRVEWKVFTGGRGIAHGLIVTCVRRLAMAYFERVRDVVSGPFSGPVIEQRTAAGWQLVSNAGQRELPDTEAPPDGAFSEAIPYGLRISDDCSRLEVHPGENQVLLLLMDLLAQDFSYSSIVSDLNEKGYRTREGKPWSRIAVFNMMPRLIEVGPRIFSSEEWEKRRLRIARRSPPEK